MDITAFENGLDVGEIAGVLAGEDVERKKEVFSDLKDSTFLIPYNKTETDIRLLKIAEKGEFLPAFTSYAEFMKSPLDHEKVVILPFVKLESILSDAPEKVAGIVVNPHGQSLLIQRKTSPLEPAEPPPQEPGAPLEKQDYFGGLKLSRPNYVPEPVLAALTGFFNASDNVYRAWLLLSQGKEEIAPHLLLLVDFDGEREAFFTKVAKSVRPFFHKGDRFEMMKADFKLIRAAEKLTHPFYQKA
ncbi:MAG TPA: enhanced serine sensitivity protein SseB C-terminal domain-containing protein [Oscillospiraceae bacterium]|nr:enhanced serine sensitivity protein SseB C-terminal domain-containing protein [Oscillospiraceae bacterium]HNW04261.1 enhanced serine sensitivity protein SseB C-terminal domain-containing protein [Oscillospiraceae bacterium]